MKKLIIIFFFFITSGLFAQSGIITWTKIINVTNDSTLMQKNNFSDVPNKPLAISNLGAVAMTDTLDKIMTPARTATLIVNALLGVADINLSNIDVDSARVKLLIENVDNTKDTDKPVSTATQTAIDSTLKKEQNLYDLPDKAAARTNLDVYTKAEVEALIDSLIYEGSLPRPLNVLATTGLEKITLTWANPINYDSIYIYRGLNSEPLELLYRIGLETSFNDTNVVVGKTYTYRLTGLIDGDVTQFSQSSSTYPYPDTTAYTHVKYVSKSGSDSNAGTKQAPYLTMAKAETAALDNTVIIVLPGEYTENSDGLNYFFTGNKITDWYGMGEVIVKATSASYNFRPYGTTTQKFHNFIIDANSTNSYAVAVTNETKNKTFEYCIVKNGKASLLYVSGATIDNIDINYCTLDSSSVSASAIYIGARTNGIISLAHNTIRNITTPSGSYLLYLYGSTNDTVNFISNTISDITIGGSRLIHLRGNTFLTIDSNTITHNGRILGSEGTITSGMVKFKHNTITNNTTDTDGITLTAASQALSPIEIDSNTFNMGYTLRTSSCIYISNHDSTKIRGNNFTTNSTILYSIVKIQSNGQSTKHTVVSNNTFINKSLANYSLLIGNETTNAYDNLCDSSIVQYNTFYNARYYNDTITALNITTHAVLNGFNDGLNFRGNKIYGARYGLVNKGSGVDSLALIDYNLFVNCYQPIRMKGKSYCKIYNNTIYNNNLDAGSGMAGEIRLTENTGSDGAKYTRLKNNIVFNATGTANYSYVIADTASVTGLDIDYNLYYSQVTSNWIIGATTYSTFGDYQTAGYDTTGVNSDPMFVTSTDYSLQAGSPAINGGIDVGLAIDILKNPIIGVPDIGAYEKQ